MWKEYHRIMVNTHNRLYSLSSSDLSWWNGLWHLKREIIIWPSRIIFSPDYVITAMTLLYLEAGIKGRMRRDSLQQEAAPTDEETDNVSALFSFREFSGGGGVGGWIPTQWFPRSFSAKTCKMNSQVSSHVLCPLPMVKKKLERATCKMEWYISK